MKSKYLKIKTYMISGLSMLLILASLGSNISYAASASTETLFDDTKVETVLNVIPYEVAEDSASYEDPMMADLGDEAVAQSLLVGTGNVTSTWDIKTKGFKDVKSDAWYSQSSYKLFKDGIVTGYPDGTFRGTVKLSAEQFITMVVRANDLTVRAVAEGESWSVPFIEAAIEAGLIKEGDFKDYSASITREQMAYILVNSVEKSSEVVEYTNLDKVNASMKDSSKITAKYKEAVQKCYSLGLITGYTDGTFLPQNVLNRAEAATVVNRLIDKAERPVFVVNNDLSSMMYGGANWVDPLLMGTLKNMEYREQYIKNPVSEITPSTTGVAGMYGIPDEQITQIKDMVKVSIGYSTTKAEIDKQLSELNFELGRRLDKDELKIVQDYINKKTDSTTSIYKFKAFKFSDSLDEKENYNEHIYLSKYKIIVHEYYFGGMLNIPFQSSGVTFTIVSRGGSLVGEGISGGALEKFEVVYQTPYVK